MNFWERKPKEQLDAPLNDLESDTIVYKLTQRPEEEIVFEKDQESNSLPHPCFKQSEQKSQLRQTAAITKDFGRKILGGAEYADQNQDQEFDTNGLYLYRVKLQEKSDYVAPVQKTGRQAALPDIKKQFDIGFQCLQISKFDSTSLGDNQVYILVTPVTLYAWFGDKVEKVVKTGALQIMKAFCMHFEPLAEKFQQQVSYNGTKMYNEYVKFKCEFQGYESPLFLNNFGFQTSVESSDDRMNYMMLRSPK